MTQSCQMAAKTSSWSSTFPTELNSHVDSCQFMKKLLGVSISNILYLRGLLTDECYNDRNIDNVVVKILDENSDSPGVREIVKWIRGCFDALEMRYLRQVLLGIYANKFEPDKILESYTFKFAYHLNTTIMTLNEEKENSVSGSIACDVNKKATIELLKSIKRMTQSFEKIPEMTYLTMKLLYYDEITPLDYQPPGFKSCSEVSFKFVNENSGKIDIAKVGSNFHSLNVSAQTSVIKGEDSNNQQQLKCLSQQMKQVNSGHSSCANSPTNLDKGVRKETSPKANRLKKTYDKNVDNPSDDEVNEEEIKCPCGDKSNDGLMICCERCKKWQHGVCFAVLEEDQAPKYHICDLCNGQEEFICVDQALMGLSSEHRMPLALYRRALQHGSIETTLSIGELVKKLDVAKHVAQNIIHKLESEMFLTNGKGRFKGKKVVVKKNIVEHGYKKYFDINAIISEEEFPNLLHEKLKKGRKSTSSSNTDGESVISKTSSIHIESKATSFKRKISSQTENAEHISDQSGQKRSKCIEQDTNFSV